MVRHVRARGGTGIKDETIVSEDIKNYTILSSDLGSSCVTTTKINDKAVTTAKGSPDFVDGTLIADNAVNTEHINAKAITTAKGSPNFVTNSLIGSAFVQGGSAKSGSYFTFPTTYGAVPKGVVAIPMDSFSHATYPVYVGNITAGSCIPHGSVNGWLQVVAVGNK